jgi:glucose/arabinose dehydrogenase
MGFLSQSKFFATVTLIALIFALALTACTDDSDDDTTSGEPAPTAPIEASDPQETPAVDSDEASDPQETPVVDPDEDATDAIEEAEETSEGTEEPANRLQELDLDIELFAEGFIQPTDMVMLPDGSDRILVVNRIGVIQVIEDAEIREEPFLDIRNDVEHHMVEQGMLSIALHPEFNENGYFYVYYINHGDEHSIISRFEVSDDRERAIRESEELILEVEQPHYSHNGGNLKFGPDGYLYIGLGDGEDPGDPHEHSQNPGTLFGSILRIDVDSGDPYAIPSDNPFVDDDDARDEVWAYGLRNPWRFSFDPKTGDMYMVDVGQWTVEEVNFQPADSTGGENYGWPIMEGDQCFDAEDCDTEGLTMPVATYHNPNEGCAVIGGYPYYGEAYPELEGIYFYGDWCSGRIWGLIEEDGEWISEELIHTDLMINAFAQDLDGEIYVLNFEEGGGIFRITSR